MSLRSIVAALLMVPGLAQAQTTALSNGTAVTVPNTAQGFARTYTLNVPANMEKLVVQLTAGNGDPDIYVNFDQPYLATNDPNDDPECVSDVSGTEELCEIDNPLPGTWYIEVFAATAFGNSVSLVAFAGIELFDDVDETISGAGGSINMYFIDVPSGQGHLNVVTSGGTGNPNMSVGPDLFAPPACQSGVSGTADSCEINNPAAGTWLVRIDGTSAYTSVVLNAEYGLDPASPPGSGSGAFAPGALGVLLAAFVAGLASRRVRRRSARAP